MCILRLRSIVMTKNKRLQVQSRVVFIMNEHFNNYNPWWPREDISFCLSCPCCFTDRPRIHTDFSLIPRCDNLWKDADFAFSIWAVLYLHWKSNFVQGLQMFSFFSSECTILLGTICHSVYPEKSPRFLHYSLTTY